jgi:hypothetical protein
MITDNPADELLQSSLFTSQGASETKNQDAVKLCLLLIIKRYRNVYDPCAVELVLTRGRSGEWPIKSIIVIFMQGPYITNTLFYYEA